MAQLQRGIVLVSRGFNVVAGAAVILMMVLTCADVVLRLLRQPITGTYEIVGFLGTVIVSFSLAFTSLEKGHIAVELLVEKLPRRMQVGIEAVTSLIGAALFSLITWQSLVYAMDIRQSGEVSVTLTMPIYPFIYGIAAGSGLLCLVLLSECLRSAVRTAKS
ncbi:MAG: TRAP transporter small permease [Pseudomonadota bacterium]|nr:TRAP transporter small permease [Pseudomonadota bacterium]MBU1185063.1 TRAP transporter small permease [Pseudomonadota bacterium]MBU3930953.1 TRAP transporter small permease [Pseudomonadota bacterium]MBU4120360.1 TRAP transporter small permease [Pseudomonadota bacterium]